MYALGITQDDTATVTSATGVAESEAVVLAAGTSTSCLAAQVGTYTPPLLAHHVRFTFPVDGTPVGSHGSTSRQSA